MEKQEQQNNDNDQKINKYAIYLQKSFNDYQHLQYQHGRLLQSYRELLIKSKQSTGGHHHHHHSHHHHRSNNELDETNNNNTSNNNIDNYRQELEQEKLQNEILKNEKIQLLDNLKLMETRYKELLIIINDDNKQDNTRIKELESENKELKETLEFVTSENTVLKDAEEQTFIEKREWIEEKKKYEQVVVWSRNLNDRYKTLVSKNNQQKELFNKFFDSIIEQYDSSNEIELIEDFKKFTLNNDNNNNEDNNNINDDDNNNESTTFERKLEIIEKYMKLLSNNKQNIDQNENNFDIKIKLNELQKNNMMLKDDNECLNREITRLKALVTDNNTKSDEQTDLLVKNIELNEKLRSTEEKIEKLTHKFARNRAVLEENNRRSLEEIQTLDNFIAIIIDKLNRLPDNLKKYNELNELIAIINENDSESNI